MTTKYITGDYPAGYRLASGFSAVSIAHSAYIGGTGFEGSNAVVLNQGQITATRADVTGVRLGGVSTLMNYGSISGGGGGRGPQYVNGSIGASVGRGAVLNFGTIEGGLGNAGGKGGTGLSEHSRFSPIDNQGLVVGGEGGYANRAQYNSRGGFGGAGISVGQTDSVTNAGTIRGGTGGHGGPGPFQSQGGPGGGGGVGLRLAAGGRITNTGAILGGEGGPSDGPVVGAGGVGVDFIQGGRLYNTGLIEGGDSGPGPGSASGGYGVFQRDGGTIVNAGTILGGAGYGTAAAGVSVTGVLRNSGFIAGYYGVVTFGAAARVINNGTISSAGYPQHAIVGVRLESGGRLENHGLIESGHYSYAYFGVVARGGATVVNDGTIQSGFESISLDASSVLISEAGATFIGEIAGGGGTFDLAGGSGSLTGLGAGGVMSGADSGTFAGFGSYQIGGGGHWALNGVGALGANQSLTVDGGLVISARSQFSAAAGSTITVGERGALRFEGGSQTVSGATVDSGLIAVHRGTTLTIGGTVTGSGMVVINDGALHARTAFNLAVTFASGGGTLDLAQSQTFTATITGLAEGDTLDLDDVAFTGGNQTSFSGTATGGVLTVTDGTHTASLHLAGDYLGRTFGVASDGAGGIDVTLQAAAAHAFVAAMACHGPMTPVGMSSFSPHAEAAPPLLLAPPRAFAL